MLNSVKQTTCLYTGEAYFPELSVRRGINLTSALHFTPNNIRLFFLFKNGLLTRLKVKINSQNDGNNVLTTPNDKVNDSNKTLLMQCIQI